MMIDFQNWIQKLRQERQDIDEWYDSEVEELNQDYVDKLEQGEETSLEQHKQKVHELTEKYNKLISRSLWKEKMLLKIVNFLRPKKKRLA